MAATPPPSGDAGGPAIRLGFDRLLIVGTGSVAAALLPFWLTWFRSCDPEPEIRVVLTRAACRFVTPDAVAAYAHGPVVIDDWDAVDGPVHVDLARWAEVALVYPATLHYLSRLALGLVDTPSLLALQAFTGTLALAPALPPGTVDAPAVRRHLAALREDPRVVLAPTVTARSLGTGQDSDGSLAPLPAVLSLVARHRRRRDAA